MQIGNVVKNVFTNKLGLITDLADGNYVEVDCRWLIPEEHLELISEIR